MAPPIRRGSLSDAFVHFATTVLSKRHGRALVSIWCGYLAWSTSIRLRAGRRRSCGEASLSRRTEKRHHHEGSHRAKESLRRLLGIALPHLAGKQGLLVAMYIGVLCSRIFITVKLADLSGKMASYLGARKWSAMFSGQASFGLWCILAAAITSSMKFLEKQNAIYLRKIVFEHAMEKYLSKKNRFYHQGLADPSARLTQDAAAFAKECIHIFGHVLKPCIDITHLTAVLCGRIGFKSVAIFYSFFCFSQVSINNFKKHALRKPLKECTRDQMKLEASLRQRLAAIHTSREQIAFQSGQERERMDASRIFRGIVAGSRLEAAQYALLDTVSSYTIKYGGMMAAFSVLIPGIYADPTLTGEQITASYMSNLNLLGSLASAVKDLSSSLAKVSKIKGLADRVYALLAEMDVVDSQFKSLQQRESPFVCKRSEGIGKRLHLHGVSICAPLNGEFGAPSKALDGEWLVKDLSLTILPGEHTVLKGPNGAGKSSIFRAINGLWPSFATQAQGRIEIPKSMFILPQDAYFPSSSLGSQVTYPAEMADRDRHRVVECMGMAGIEILAERYDLDDEADWANMLSGGQKQRLVFARMFFHGPSLALLDEATSAVSADGVAQLFRSAKAANITLFTISHSDAVDLHHSQALHLGGDGSWHMRTLEAVL